jgi:hypothetical protein
VEPDGVLAQGREQFRLDRTRDRVVQALVDGRANPAVTSGDTSEFTDVLDAEVADAELVEQALLVQVLDASERRFQRRAGDGGWLPSTAGRVGAARWPACR